MVHPPDQKGRAADPARSTRRKVPLADDVDLERLASATPGMTGADLANLVNEAALLAARRGAGRRDQRDFTDALEKVQLGAARNVVIPEAERRRTAYHEAGHALLGMLQPGADPVRKVSIIPRGRALGVTLSTPETDRYGYDANYLRGRIIGALGGMAAEQEVFDVVTTGAESDLEMVTRIARSMVGRWGMSERIGTRVGAAGRGRSPHGGHLRRDCSTPWTRRSGASPTSATPRRGGCCGRTATSSTRSSRSCSRSETLDEPEVYAAAGIAKHEPPRPAGRYVRVALRREGGRVGRGFSSALRPSGSPEGRPSVRAGLQPCPLLPQIRYRSLSTFTWWMTCPATM